MPTIELNVESQIASEITRTDLQTLISSNAVERKQYYITNAVNNTRKVAVFYRSPNQTTFGAVDVNTGVYGRYFIVQDMFIAIAEAQGAVLTYINLASFPVSGAANTVYIAQDTGTGYTWNGSAYVALSGGTVFAANFGALPVTGAANTLYITTDNGNSYLWDGSQYVLTSSNEPLDLDFIPRSGTVAGFPLAEALFEVSKGTKFGYTDVEGALEMEFNAGLAEVGLKITYDTEEYFFSKNPETLLNNVLRLYQLKSRLFNKAGVPTTSDDSGQGYVANQSLLLDTTTGIIYRCTNATAGAATWSVYYNPSSLLLDTIRIGSTVGAGLTRYACVGTSGLSTTLILNLAPKRIHRNFRVVTGTVQSATGAMTISRVFTTYAGVVAQTDTLTIPANSPVGEYVFSGATFNATAGFNVRFDIVQGAGTSAFIQGIENEYE